ncbi:MAG: DinB family protein [bacterium]|nr:DinB family protein [bacterium]
MTEPQILAAVLDSSRQLTHFYLDELKDVDKSRTFKIGDFQTNNVHWIVAHLAWSEDTLILRGVGNDGIAVPWFELFRLGVPSPPLNEYPPFNETFDVLKQVHQATISLLNSLPTEALDQPNNFGRKIMGQDSKRILIHHCIRHEGVHCGHLGWLARLHGLKVI